MTYVFFAASSNFLSKIDDLKRRKEVASMGGGERRISAQHAKGKMTARERIEVLLDEDSFVD